MPALEITSGFTWAHPGRDARRVLAGRRIDQWLLRVPALAATVLSKFSLPPFGALGLSIAIPLLASTTLAGLALGRLAFVPRRLQAWLLLLCGLLTLQLATGNGFSLASLLLLAVLHLPYVVQLRRPTDYPRLLDATLALCAAIAALGVAQYTLQTLVGPTLAFPMENLLPDALRVSKFNMQGRLEYGSTLYRTNGVFMLEPSFYSQFLALGIVIEMVSRRRAWVVAGLLAAIALSFSGTGLILLGICGACLAVHERRWLLMGGSTAAAAAVLALGVATDNPYARIFLVRAGEFSATGSSGFARFVGGFYLFEQFLWVDPWRALTGFGAGALQSFQHRAHWPFGENALFKIVFEFGLLGAACYYAFLAACLVRSAAPPLIRIATGVMYLLGGVYLPFSHSLVIGLVLWPGMRTTPVSNRGATA